MPQMEEMIRKLWKMKMLSKSMNVHLGLSISHGNGMVSLLSFLFQVSYHLNEVFLQALTMEPSPKMTA